MLKFNKKYLNDVRVLSLIEDTDINNDITIYYCIDNDLSDEALFSDIIYCIGVLGNVTFSINNNTLIIRTINLDENQLLEFGDSIYRKYISKVCDITYNHLMEQLLEDDIIVLEVNYCNSARRIIENELINDSVSIESKCSLLGISKENNNNYEKKEIREIRL